MDQFIASFKRAPRKLILDFDATDDPVHGNQEGRFFDGYYDHYGYLRRCMSSAKISYWSATYAQARSMAHAVLV